MLRCLLDDDEEEKKPKQKPETIKCKVRVIKEILDLFPECRPEVGEVYDAEFSDYTYWKCVKKQLAIIDVNGKRILLRDGEFELAEG